jgi:hypothetical protein
LNFLEFQSLKDTCFLCAIVEIPERLIKLLSVLIPVVITKVFTGLLYTIGFKELKIIRGASKHSRIPNKKQQPLNILSHLLIFSPRG